MMRRILVITGVALITAVVALPAFAKASESTFLDTFATQSYNGNEGTRNFKGPWREINEGNGPTTGDVSVANHPYCDGAWCLKIGGSGSGFTDRGVHRAVDLAEATWAQLVFDYGRELPDDDSDGTAVVQISSNGGDSWSTLKTIALDQDDDGTRFRTTIVISKWASRDTVIRFKITEAENLDAYWLIDNVSVESTYMSPATTITEPPTSTTTTTEPKSTTTTTDDPETTTTTRPLATTTTTTPPETTTTTRPLATTTTTTPPETTTTTTEPPQTTTTRPLEPTTTTVPVTTTSTAPPLTFDEAVSPEDQDTMMNKSGLTVTAAMPRIAIPTSAVEGSTQARTHAEPVEALAAAFFTHAGSYGGNLLSSIALGIVIAVVCLLGIGSRKEE